MSLRMDLFSRPCYGGELTCHPHGVRSISLGRDELISGGGDGCIRGWCLNTLTMLWERDLNIEGLPKKLGKLDYCGGKINKVAHSPSGKYILVLAGRNLWSIQVDGAQLRHSFPCGDNLVDHAAWQTGLFPHGGDSYILTLRKNELCRTRRLRDKKHEKHQPISFGRCALGVASLGSVTAVTFNCNRIEMFDAGLSPVGFHSILRPDRSAWRIKCPGVWITRSHDPGNYFIVGAEQGGLVRIVYHGVGSTETTYYREELHSAQINCMTSLPWGYMGASADLRGVIQVWDTDLASIAEFEGHAGAVNALAMDRKYVYSGGEDGTIRRWLIDTKPAPIVHDKKERFLDL